MEFGLSGCGTMAALAILLAEDNGRGGGDLHTDHELIGSWSGDPIRIVGDYGDESAAVLCERPGKGPDPCQADEHPHVTNWYALAQEHFEELSPRLLPVMVEDGMLCEALVQAGVWCAGCGIPKERYSDPPHVCATAHEKAQKAAGG